MTDAGGNELSPIEQLRAYIYRRLNQGLPRGDIEDELIAQGHPVDFVVEQMDYVRQFDTRAHTPAWAVVESVESLPLPVQGLDEQPSLEQGMVGSRLAVRQTWIDPPSSIQKYALIISLVFGSLMIIGGLTAQGRFWALWLAGTKATATVTHTEKRVVGHAYTRRSAAAGVSAPMVDTGFHYSFRDATGGQAAGTTWVAGPSSIWESGDTLPIMYFSSNPQQSVPASLGFYLSNDTGWTMALTSVLVGIPVFAIGAAGYLRMRRDLKRAASSSLAAR